MSRRLAEAGSTHRERLAVMLPHLVGANLQAPGVASLADLISVLEPAKRYERGGLQVWSNQLVPLVGIADAASPESDPSREFGLEVDRMVFAAGAIDRSMGDSVARRMGSMSAAAKVVADTLAGTYPAVREAVPSARDLIDGCAVGSAAVQALVSGVPFGADALGADLAALDRDAAPNGSATVVPVLKPIRILVAAAARQAERRGVSDDDWRLRVLSTAFPANQASPER